MDYNKSLISIITVCYNSAEKLEKTIESVVTQTYSFIEYIIVDGASRDNTCEIVERYNTEISQFISEPDRGIYDAMNKGIRHANGSFILFLNAGDYFVSKEVIEIYISKIKVKEADLFYGRIVWNDVVNKDLVLSDHDNTKFEWDLMSSNFPHPATLYKKELFDAVGLFNEDFHILSDYEWNVRALIVDKIKFQYINTIVTVFYVDGVSNNIANAEIIKNEIFKIKMLYSRPSWFDFISKEYFENKTGKRILERLFAKISKKKLNRIY